jgi:hypothetical protein
MLSFLKRKRNGEISPFRTLSVYFDILHYIPVHSFHHIHTVHSSVPIRRALKKALKLLEGNFLQLLLVCLMTIRVLVCLTRIREIVRLFRVNRLVRRGPTKIFCANFRIESFRGITGTKNFVINAVG